MVAFLNSLLHVGRKNFNKKFQIGTFKKYESSNYKYKAWEEKMNAWLTSQTQNP